VSQYGTVADQRMGSIDRSIKCLTCAGEEMKLPSGKKDNSCPGHFGHIELARRVYHCGFIRQVIDCLNCVCFHCSTLLVDSANPEFQEILRMKNPELRLKKLSHLCKGKKQCGFSSKEQNEEMLGGSDSAGGSAKLRGGCGNYLPKYRKEGLGIIADFHRDDPENGGIPRQSLSAERAFTVLNRISDAHAIILGFDPRWVRPEWMVIKVLPVPPPQVRPSVIEDGAMSQDDLTHVLVNIIKTNQSLESQVQRGEAAHIIEQTERLLQIKVANFFDNGSGGIQETQRGGKLLKTIAQRIKGKEGRIRGNLMGKRVDFSGRTVITADPNLSLDEVGVPKSIARNLTVPEMVTPYNITEMHTLVARGADEHPGAKFLIKGDDRFDLRFVRDLSDISLQPGWVVERHLKDGDVIVFNRQPSLHKMSIMCHRVRVLDWSTFRLNLAVTSPYNADFDGDEMNLHVPQSLTARAEAGSLMRVSKLIVSPQSNTPVMSIVQDSLVAVQRMTKRDTFLDKPLFFNTLMWVKTWDGRVPIPAILKPKPLWTGKQVFSLFVPKLNFKGGSSQGPPTDKHPNTFYHYDDKVLIHDGELLHGVIDKKSVGSRSGGLIHLSFLEHGSDACRDFMDSLQVVVNYWILNVSLSVGVQDTITTPESLDAVSKFIADAKSTVEQLLQKAQCHDDIPESERIQLLPGQSMLETFEDNVGTTLQNAREKAGKEVLATLNEKNNFKAMAMAGSKGNDVNISQIMACVGPQKVEGNRIAFGFKRRSLPHFRKDDLSAESKGFVTNSYLRGLTAQEFYFHAMGGREGLIDTACKTSITGYLQRRLVKSMESVMCQYDGTLRNSAGNIIQMMYGEDGLDGAWVEMQSFPSVGYFVCLSYFSLAIIYICVFFLMILYPE
jgi:DNA-directed RNA polymerase II subunit RPB1